MANKEQTNLTLIKEWKEECQKRGICLSDLMNKAMENELAGKGVIISREHEAILRQQEHQEYLKQQTEAQKEQKARLSKALDEKMAKDVLILESLLSNHKDLNRFLKMGEPKDWKDVNNEPTKLWYELIDFARANKLTIGTKQLQMFHAKHKIAKQLDLNETTKL